MITHRTWQLRCEDCGWTYRYWTPIDALARGWLHELWHAVIWR